MKIIDGKKIAEALQEELKKKIALLSRKPSLAFLLVGKDLASMAYIQNKQKACSWVGIHSEDRRFPIDISEKKLLQEIKELNQNPKIDGILVQLPLPLHINLRNIQEAILPSKDVDGFHPLNVGKMFLGEKDGFIPCTPKGILHLLEHSKIEIKTKHVVILGRSNIVGKPLAVLLLEKGLDATVTVVHSQTKDLSTFTKMADILVVAMGKPLFVKEEMVKKGVVIIDVGVNRIVDERGQEKIVGDVDFERVVSLASAITPVPGGIGPMTIYFLLQNTYESALRSRTSHSPMCKG